MGIVLGMIHGIHVLGAVLWIGGLLVLVHAVLPSVDSLEPIQRVRVIGPAIHRISRVGWLGVLLLIATGIYLLLHTPFSLFTILGRAILLKLMIIGVMLGAFAYGYFGLFSDYQKYGPKVDENLSEEDIAKVVRFLDELAVSVGRWYRFTAYSGILVIVVIEIGIVFG
jgi:uncharacterized membrane protein